MKFEFSWVYLLYALFIFLIFIGVRIILFNLRKKTINHLNELLYLKENFFLYQELLKNKRLRLIFRKEMIDILKLNGYLLEGDENKIKEMIHKLDNSILEPFEKLDYYQKRFSYFVEQNDRNEANKSLQLLKEVFKKAKNPKTISIIEEAEFIYEIYIMHNTKLIPDLIEKEKMINDPIRKGVTQYRIAKLYYYQNNQDKVNIYLEKAKNNVKGSYWYPIIIEAQKNNHVLAKK